jgi:hypothetical protein
MKRLVAGLVLSSCLTVGGAGVLGHVGGSAPERRPWLAEDDPGWDCRLDGDRSCGEEK